MSLSTLHRSGPSALRRDKQFPGAGLEQGKRPANHRSGFLGCGTQLPLTKPASLLQEAKTALQPWVPRLLRNAVCKQECLSFSPKDQQGPQAQGHLIPSLGLYCSDTPHTRVPKWAKLHSSRAKFRKSPCSCCRTKPLENLDEEHSMLKLLERYEEAMWKIRGIPIACLIYWTYPDMCEHSHTITPIMLEPSL